MTAATDRADGTARCPLCRRVIPTFVHRGRAIYLHHNPTRALSVAPCDASGWLVEDDEVIVEARAVKTIRRQRRTTA